MAHIKNQAVKGSIKYGFNGNGQLYHAKVRRQMAAGLADMVNEKFTDLPAQLLPVTLGQIHKVLVAIDVL